MSTSNARAQQYFDQGLRLAYAFNHWEARRAFRAAQKLDPQCAMCYWGIYQAEIFRHSSSKHFADAALAKAVSLKGHASKAERLYIEASAAHEAEEKDKKNEADCLMDGAWTGHPDQNQIAVDQFPFPNQLQRRNPHGERYPNLRPALNGVGKKSVEGTRAAISFGPKTESKPPTSM